MSIDITWPALHQVNSQSWDAPQRAYLEPSDKHPSLSSISLPKGNPLIRIDGLGWLGNDGRGKAMVNTMGRLGDGHTFQQGYLRNH